MDTNNIPNTDYVETQFEYLGLSCQILIDRVGLRHCVIALPADYVPWNSTETLTEMYGQVADGVLFKVTMVIPKVPGLATTVLLHYMKRPDKVPVPDLGTIVENYGDPQTVQEFKSFLMINDITDDDSEIITCEDMIEVAKGIMAFFFEKDKDSQQQEVHIV